MKPYQTFYKSDFESLRLWGRTQNLRAPSPGGPAPVVCSPEVMLALIRLEFSAQHKECGVHHWANLKNLRSATAENVHRSIAITLISFCFLISIDWNYKELASSIWILICENKMCFESLFFSIFFFSSYLLFIYLFSVHLLSTCSVYQPACQELRKWLWTVDKTLPHSCSLYSGTLVNRQEEKL